MAKLSPPVKNKEKDVVASTIETAKSSSPIDQFPPDSIKPLQLKLPENRKNEFKAYAAMRGRSMNSLFLEMFDEYKQKHA